MAGSDHYHNIQKTLLRTMLKSAFFGDRASLQANLDASPHNANRAHNPTARRALLRPEHMLDTSAYPALGVVRSLLRRRQPVVASTASVNPAPVTAGPELGLDLGRPISAVGEHIIAGVALVQ